MTAGISDMQATLVNKMAAKPDSYENQDEDLKVIDMSPIKSLFYLEGVLRIRSF